MFGAEFARKLRSRAFVVGTIAGILSVAIIVLAPVFFGRALRASSSSIILVGPPLLRARAAELLRPDYEIVAQRSALPPPITESTLDGYNKAAAAIVLSTEAHRLRIDVFARDLSQVGAGLEQTLAPLQLGLATGDDRAEVARLMQADLRTHAVGSRFADAGAAELAHGVAFALIFVLYISIIITSQSVMASVAEEKTSRIAELLVATISPTHLLAGKVLAAGTLGLAQIAVWGASGAALAVLTLGGLVHSGARVPPTLVSPATGALFLAFFCWDSSSLRRFTLLRHR